MTMKGLLEQKVFTAELKDLDLKSMKVSGWWASYGNKDYDHDIIEMGAARKTISERGPKGTNEIFFLNQHNWDQPHGKPSVLEDQPKGIYFESTVAPTSYGKDAILLYEAGLVIQHSIGFQTIKSEDSGSYSDGTHIRHIKEIKLYEGSNVTLGANPNTPFMGFKSLTLDQVNDQIAKMMKLLRNGSLTDDGFMQLEIGLKQLQLHSYELGKQAQTDIKSLIPEEPEASTLITEEPIVNTEIINVLKNFKLN